MDGGCPTAVNILIEPIRPLHPVDLLRQLTTIKT
jgi:hypothetical protein